MFKDVWLYIELNVQNWRYTLVNQNTNSVLKAVEYGVKVNVLVILNYFEMLEVTIYGKICDNGTVF